MSYRRIRVPYTYESLLALYAALLGDAVVIMPVSQAVTPEENLYDVIDIAYDLATHFHVLYGSPLLTRPNLTKRNLTMRSCIAYVVRCHEVIQSERREEKKQEEECHGTRTTKRKYTKTTHRTV